MKFDILNCFNGAVQFSAEIECADDESPSIKLGLAVRIAIKSDANLRGANLIGADLIGADLSCANLIGAYLRGAYLSDANLSCADLSCADLIGADLIGADLIGAYLRGADSAIDAGVPNGFRVVGWLHDGTLMLRAGCKNFTATEAAAYWDGRPERAECEAALEYIKTVAALRKWKIEAPQAGSEAAVISNPRIEGEN